MTVKKSIEVVATFTQKGLKNFKKNINSWNASMSAPISRMREVQTEQGKWNKGTKEGSTMMGRAALGVRKATHGMRGFRMEMLGVMFFGMAMQRMFGGLMKTSMEWTGIMEILSATLGVVFLPVVLQLTEALIPISSWFMTLSDSTKLWIGWIAVLGFVLGTALMIIGQVALGIGSLLLVQASGISLSALFIGTLASLTSALFSLSLVALAVAGAFLVMKGALGSFDKDFDNSVAKWQRGGGFIAKTIGFIVRILHLGGALVKTGFLNVIDTIILAFQGMLNLIIFGMNMTIRAMNLIPGINIPIIPKIDWGALDRIASRTSELVSNTPTLGNLLTGGPVTPNDVVDGRTNAEKRGEVSQTSITNNYNGFTMEELKKEIDLRDSELVAQLESNA